MACEDYFSVTCKGVIRDWKGVAEVELLTEFVWVEFDEGRAGTKEEMLFISFVFAFVCIISMVLLVGWTEIYFRTDCRSKP